MSVLIQIFMQGTLGGQSLRDIKPPLEMPQNLLPYFISGTVVFGLVAALLWYVLQKNRQPLSTPIKAEDDTPLAHEVAYKNGQRLSIGLVKRGDWSIPHPNRSCPPPVY